MAILCLLYSSFQTLSWRFHPQIYIYILTLLQGEGQKTLLEMPVTITSVSFTLPIIK